MTIVGNSKANGSHLQNSEGGPELNSLGAKGKSKNKGKSKGHGNKGPKGKGKGPRR